jgi:hypothetical protein
LVLAQTDFVEHQQQGAAQPERDQSEEEHLAGQSAYEDAAQHPGDDEQAG